MSHPYRWVIVAAGGLLGCVAIGAMFSLPVFLRPISQDTGWSVTGISAALMIPAALLVRRPPALDGEQAETASDGPQPDMTIRQALRSPQFVTLMLANFFCCATHSGPIFHTVSYAVTCGIPMIAAVSIYSVEGLAAVLILMAFRPFPARQAEMAALKT